MSRRASTAIGLKRPSISGKKLEQKSSKIRNPKAAGSVEFSKKSAKHAEEKPTLKISETVVESKPEDYPEAFEGGAATPMKPYEAVPSDTAPKNDETLRAINTAQLNYFEFGPSFGHKFPMASVKILIQQILKERFANKTYAMAEAKTWAADVADEVSVKLTGAFRSERYKHVVNVMIYQQTGAGCFYMARTFWDNNADDYTTESYDNGNFVSICTVFACYQH